MMTVVRRYQRGDDREFLVVALRRIELLSLRVELGDWGGCWA